MAKFIVSKIDQRLKRFYTNKAKTDSENNEINKQASISRMRDIAQEKPTPKTKDIWENF